MIECCPLCEQSRHRPRFVIKRYQLIECLQCGLVRLHPFPTPEELRVLYSGTYFKSESASERGYLDYEGDHNNYLRTFRRRLKMIRDYLSASDRILEVGCALGFFLDTLREAGFEHLTGIDLSAYAIARAQARMGNQVELLAGNIGDLPSGRSFDVVFMWDVLEHIPNPIAALNQVRVLLNPGGRLILETQDVGSVMAQINGRRWHMYKVPEHLYHFQPSTIKMLLNKTGFQVVKITRRGAGKYLSGSFIVERVGRYSPVLKYLVVPLEGSIRSIYVNLCDEMIVVAKVERAAE